jgi:hypothetical protein
MIYVVHDVLPVATRKRDLLYIQTDQNNCNRFIFFGCAGPLCVAMNSSEEHSDSSGSRIVADNNTSHLSSVVWLQPPRTPRL